MTAIVRMGNIVKMLWRFARAVDEGRFGMKTAVHSASAQTACSQPAVRRKMGKPRREYRDPKEHCCYIARMAAMAIAEKFDHTLLHMDVSLLADQAASAFAEAAALALVARDLLARTAQAEDKNVTLSEFVDVGTYRYDLQEKIIDLIWERYGKGSSGNLWELSDEQLVDTLIEKSVDGLMYSLTAYYR